MKDDIKYTLGGVDGSLIREQFPDLSSSGLEVRLLKVEAFGI
jgi:hypothetical protein